MAAEHELQLGTAAANTLGDLPILRLLPRDCRAAQKPVKLTASERRDLWMRPGPIACGKRHEVIERHLQTAAVSRAVAPEIDSSTFAKAGQLKERSQVEDAVVP